MKSVILQRPGELVVVEESEPQIVAPDEVLVATRRVGLCGTDYNAYRGNQNFLTYPRVLGHELSVEVLEVGAAVRNVRPGDHCAVLPYLPCQRCLPCRRGRTNCCEHLDVLGVTVDGGLRERFVVRASALFSRSGLDLDSLALVETLGIGFHAVGRSNIQPGENALVLGAGPIGLAVAQALIGRRARVIMADIAFQRLEVAKSLIAIDVLIARDGLVEQLREFCSGDLPTMVFDATGNRQSMESALEMVSFSGSLILVGHTTGTLTFDNPTLHRREITIQASRNAGPSEWLPLLDLIGAGVVDARPWITGRTQLEAVPAQLPAWGESGDTVIKGIVEIGDGSKVAL